MELVQSRPESCSELRAHADGGHREQCWLSRRVAIFLLIAVLVKGLLLALVLSPVFNMAAPGTEQSAGDAGKAAEVAGQLSECRAELRATSLLLHRISQDWQCQLCPGGWLWSRGSCYYFSVGLQEDRRWNESAAFCQQHDAHLAVIGDHREMEVIQAQMGTYEPMAFLWVGLTDSLEEGQWMWEDGQPHQDHTLSEVQWNSEERDCADIRGDGSLFASNCEAHGPWVCEKPWNPRKPSSPASLA